MTADLSNFTFENGREFAGYEQIAEQYFPKKQPLGKIKKHQLDFVMHRLNTRPRKTLDFVAPEVIYYKTVKLIA